MGDKIVVVGGQADGKLVPADRGLRRRALDRRGRASPRRASTSARPPTAATSTRSAGARCRPTRTPARWSATTPQATRWTKLDAMPKPAGSVGVAYAAGRVIAVGGEGTTTVVRRRPGLRHPEGPLVAAALAADRPPRRRRRRDRRLALRDRRRDRARTRRLDQGSGRAGPLRAAAEAPTTARASSGERVADAPSRRQYAAATEVGGRVWLFGGIGEDEDRHHRHGGLRPRDQHLDVGTEAAAAAAPRGGRDLQGRRGRDRRLRARGRADLGAIRPRLRAARRRVGGAAAAQPCPRRGRRGGGGRQDRRGRRPGRRQARAARPRSSTARAGRTCADIPTPREHLGAASDGRYLYAVGGRNALRGQELGALERYDPASDSWTKLRGHADGRPAASARRSSPGA